MLKRLGQQLRIGVAPGGVALVRCGAWRRTAPELLAERALGAGATRQQLLAAVNEVLAGCVPRGASVVAVLADDLARLWQVAPPPGCARLSDLQAAAAMRFRALFGAGGPEWRSAAEWDAARPFLAGAAPEPLVEAIQAAIRSHGGHAVEVVPQFAAALNAWGGRADAWFGLVQSGVLTLALFDAGALIAVRAVAVPHDAGPGWLGAHVQREAMRLGISTPRHLQMEGAVPASWASHPGCTLPDAAMAHASGLAQLACTGAARAARQLNLASPSLRGTLHRAPRAARAAALAAALLLPVVGACAYQYTQALQRYALQLAALHVRARAPAALQVAVRVPQVSASQAAAINATVMQLNLPWRDLRDAVAAATPPAVGLLALEPDANNRILRISAQARSSDDMVAYVEQLQAQPAFANVALTRHEIDEQDPSHPLRFQLDARWRQP